MFFVNEVLGGRGQKPMSFEQFSHKEQYFLRNAAAASIR